ncbi:sarcosine oxidase subunit beta family protein [Alphaproteobacteria bacterium]|nr:sarcosine oxidase subunit beta family protein [Alphaproteobacteria bacterium]
MYYNVLKILKEGLNDNKGWKKTWQNPEIKKKYDVIIIGGGGHGLATAFYLAKEFKIKNIAVLEKNWIGGGNVGRNTTIIRSNYLLNENEAFYEFSLKLWETLENQINYNAMVSQRGVLNVFHSDAQRDSFVRRGNSMIINGADAELFDVDKIKSIYPFLDYDNARFPIKGGLFQKRGGSVRHDAVAWGYAHAADELGVDIIQNCEVTGFKIKSGTCIGVETNKGDILANKIGCAVAGSSSVLMSKANMNLPLESHVLQAFVSESLKPFIPGVITFGAGHFYISQSDKGGLVFGGDIDGYNSYAQRGGMDMLEDVCEGGLALMPTIGKARLLRMWGGIMDMSMDGSPIIDKTHIKGLYLNAGWCYGGFKATPASGWCFAHLLAKGASHSLSENFQLDRFKNGYMIDEKGQGAQPNLH